MAYSIGAVVGVKGDEQYKSALSGIRTEMQNVKLQSNLLTSAFGKNERSVESLTAQNRQLKQVEDLQRRAMEETRAAMERLKAENQEGSEAYKKLQQNLLKIETELNNTEQAIKRNTLAMQKLQQQKLSDALDDTKSSMSGLATTLRNGVVAFAALAAAAVAAGKAFISFASDQADIADALATTSQNIGVSTRTLQEWDYAARFIDTSTESMQKGLAKTVKAMGAATSAGSSYIEVSDGLSVSLYGADGQLKSSEQAFYDVIDALGGMDNATQREIAAQALFGKSYQDMLPLINAGSSALKAYADEADAMGAIVSDKSITALCALDDALERVDATWSATKMELAAAIASPMEAFADKAAEAVKKLKTKLDTPSVQRALNSLAAVVGDLAVKLVDVAANALPKIANAISWLIDNGRTLVSILVAVVAGFVAFKAVVAIANLVTLLVTAIGMLKAGLTGAAIAQGALNTTMNMNPIVALLSLFAALITAVVTYSMVAGDAGDTTAQVTNKLKDNAKAMKDTREEYEDSVSSIREQRNEYVMMLAELETLASQTNRTAGEQVRMQTIIDSLNDSVDGLNLSYDEQANALNVTTDAILRMIEAQLRQAELEALIAKGVQARKNLAAAQEAQAQAQSDYDAKTSAYASTQAQSGVAPNSGQYDNTHRPGMGAVSASAVSQNDTAGQAAANLNNANAQVVAAEEALAATNAEIDTFVGSLGGATDATSEATDAATESAEAQEELAAAYEYAADRVEYYANYTQDAFGRIQTSAATTVDEMVANLNANQETIAQWTTNLGILAESGLDSGFLQTLRDMGPEAASTVQGMVDYINGGGTFDELNAAYASGAAAADQAVMDELSDVPEQFFGIGQNVGDGLAQGIMSKIGTIYAAGLAAGQAAIDGAADATEVQSPSKKARYLGDMFDAGYAGGLAGGVTQMVEAAKASMGMVMGVFQNPSAALSIPSLPDSVGTVGGTTINLTVTDPSPAYMDYLFDKFNVRLAGVAG